MSNQDLLNRIKQISGVQGVVIASKEGLVQDSYLSDSTDPNMVGAVMSSVFTNIEVQSKRMQRGEPKKIIVETDSQVISIMEYNTGSENVLVFGEFGKDMDIESLNNEMHKIS